MRRLVRSMRAGVFSLSVAVATGASSEVLKRVVIDQGIDQATLERYHYTDQEPA